MTELKCAKCGGTEFMSRGKYCQCKKCGTYKKLSKAETKFKSNWRTAEVDAIVSERVKNEKDAMKACNVDEKIWRVDRWTCGVDEGWRKDRQVEWVVRKGEVLYGEVHDTGKIIAKPVYRVKLWLVRKTEEIHTRAAVDDILKELRKHSPKVARVKYPKVPENLIYEIDFPDLHFGKLAWAEESGADYDIKIAKQAVITALGRMLSYADKFKVSRILLPLGNDYFNSDSRDNATTAGTPQQEDTRWAKTYNLGRRLACEIIEQCFQLAPVDVVIVPGNHDTQRSFYMGDSIECYFRNNQNVNVDNSAMPRKYVSYGKVLLGFTHGAFEKADRLLTLMPEEKPELWGKSKYREWHLGDRHHEVKRETRKPDVPMVEEFGGITVRVLRSLTAPDRWHFEHGFVGALRAAEGFLWSPESGLIAQFTASGIEGNNN